VRIITRGPNVKYGRARSDKRGARALKNPNRITVGGRGLKRGLNGT
jgi:hypothetical protein